MKNIKAVILGLLLFILLMSLAGCASTMNLPQPTVLTVSTTNVPAAQVSTFYSVQLEAIGGPTPYTWSVSSGALPPGVTLSTNGLLSGTPTQAGTFSFVVSVRDSSTATATIAVESKLGEHK